MVFFFLKRTKLSLTMRNTKDMAEQDGPINPNHH